MQSQKEHKVVAKRMRIILKGVDKQFIDIKKKPQTQFDKLHKNKTSNEKLVKMKIPTGKIKFFNFIDWDSNKTITLFEQFKAKASDQNIPKAKKIKLTKENSMEYFAQKATGGPLEFVQDEEKKKASIKLILNAIKIWK